MSVYVRRALRGQSGATYESGMTAQEREVFYKNALYDLIESMTEMGRSAADISRLISFTPEQVQRLIDYLPQARKRADAV